MTTLLLVPLDERPVNMTHPALVAAVGHARVLLPPTDVLGRFRDPGDHDALVRWLDVNVDKVDAAIVSVDQMLYGGLVPSRLNNAAAATVMTRIAPLADLGRRVPTTAFVTITRMPDHDDAAEEPDYWDRSGRDLHRLSTLLYQSAAGEMVSNQIADLRRVIGAHTVTDVMTRRLRNHSVVLAAVDLVARGGVQRLVVCLDDTTPTSLSVLEADWVRRWVDHLDITEAVTVHSGADEVGSTLVARTLTSRRTPRPTVSPVCATPGGLDLIPPYESRPLHAAVQAQIQAVGAEATEAADADVTLVVHPPTDQGVDWAVGPYPAATATSGQRAMATTELVRAHLDRGAAVAVADVAHPNGSDPELIAQLGHDGGLAELSGYAGWNTASNTVGSVLAHAVLTVAAGDRSAHQRLLTHRLLEDHGFQTVVRRQLRTWLREQGCHTDPGPQLLGQAEALAAELLGQQLAALPQLGRQFCLRPGSVRLPWGRTFHVEFDLQENPWCVA